MYMRTTVKGKPAIVDTACKDLRDRSGLPRPPLISAMAQSPSVKDHNTVWILGGFGSPFAAIISTVKEPESDDVMK